MTDRTALKKFIADSGITITALCAKTGMSRQTLYNRLDGTMEFTVPQIEGLTRALRLSATERDRLFFGKEVAK